MHVSIFQLLFPLFSHSNPFIFFLFFTFFYLGLDFGLWRLSLGLGRSQTALNPNLVTLLALQATYKAKARVVF